MMRQLGEITKILRKIMYCFFFFFNDTATTEIYTLSLHDALPICQRLARSRHLGRDLLLRSDFRDGLHGDAGDRKSTRLNSSHLVISYAVFCLKKKKTSHSHPDPPPAPSRPPPAQHASAVSPYRAP